MSLNHDLSDLFHSMAAVMEIKGESVFKSIAFSKVSRLLKDMTLDIRKVHAEGKLDEIEGIGASSRKIISDYITTGRSVDYDELSASVPPGLIPMLEIPGLGPKTIALFWKQRDITTLEGLIKAIDEGKLDGIKGRKSKRSSRASRCARRRRAGWALSTRWRLPGRWSSDCGISNG
jgi:DNA polymerase (family 10)